MRISGRKRKKRKKCRLYQIPINRRHGDSTYNWVQGLGSAPDVPHAVNASSRKTEGNGVGVTKEPPVGVRDSEAGGVWLHGVGGGNSGEAPFSLCFTIRLFEHEVTWETILIGTTLFIETPPDILPTGSKESFVTLLEYAEDVLLCSHVIICFKKNRADQKSLIQTFRYYGFVPVAPGTHQLAVASDLMYLAYTMDHGSDSN